MERGRRRGWTEKETKSGEFDKRGWRESLSCRPYLNSNPVEGIFRSLLTRIFGHPGNIHPARLYRILSGTFLSGFQRTYPPGCSLSSKQYYSCSLTLKTEEKNWCSPHFGISKSSFQILWQFFLLLNVGKIPTKYSFHQFCSYYGLAGKSKQFSFFLGLKSCNLSYPFPAVFFAAGSCELGKMFYFISIICILLSLDQNCQKAV